MGWSAFRSQSAQAILEARSLVPLMLVETD
jgi:hypothetical protein